MPRKAGVGAIQDKRAAQNKFRSKGAEIKKELVQELTRQLEDFKVKLQAFAVKHRKDIEKDSEFREYFQEMCATIGVDPLASSQGFWSELLGMGTFYYEIAIQACEIVLASPINGGVMNLGQLQKRLNASRSKNTSIKKPLVSCKDIKRAFKTLDVFGDGCGIVSGKRDKEEEALVYCVPEEMSIDSSTILQLALEAEEPFVTIGTLISKLGWSSTRANHGVEKLVREGIVWIDSVDGHSQYWFPALFLTRN